MKPLRAAGPVGVGRRALNKTRRPTLNKPPSAASGRLEIPRPRNCMCAVAQCSSMSPWTEVYRVGQSPTRPNRPGAATLATAHWARGGLRRAEHKHLLGSYSCAALRACGKKTRTAKGIWQREGAEAGTAAYGREDVALDPRLIDASAARYFTARHSTYQPFRAIYHCHANRDRAAR
jgi:hypothetical protein